MPLDLLGVSQELAAMAVVLGVERRHRAARLEAARGMWTHIDSGIDDVITRARESSSRVTWLLATPHGSPTGRVPSPDLPSAYSVVGVDGSQLKLERHDSATCLLINTGWASLHYGTNEPAELSSAPRLYYRPEELSIKLRSGRREPIKDELLAAIRSQAELRRLHDVLLKVDATDRPVLGLIDGNLTAWTLTGLDPEIQESLIDDRMEICEAMRRRGQFLAGYISATRGSECANLLRVALCPDHPIRCDQCSTRLALGREACSPMDDLVDADVIGPSLKPGDRSQLFRSASRILKLYTATQHVYFFYLNVGAEIARIEIPAWIAQDNRALDHVHAVLVDQCARGRGYPPALTEAHEQAVVTEADRELFDALLARQLGRAGLRADTSAKQLSKLRRAV